MKTPSTPVVLKSRVADLGPADRRTFELLLGVNLEDRGIALVSGIAPIETRMSVEDLQSAHHEDGDAQHIDPMREADRRRMAVDQLAPAPAHARGFGLLRTLSRVETRRQVAISLLRREGADFGLALRVGKLAQFVRAHRARSPRVRCRPGSR